jgi:hypothetical protein
MIYIQEEGDELLSTLGNNTHKVWKTRRSARMMSRSGTLAMNN